MVSSRATGSADLLPRRRSWRRVVLGVVVVLALAAVWVAWRVRQALPAGILADVRAGAAARHITDPDARLRKYLEGRYGSLDDAENRRKAFLDFFDLEHIQALQFLVKHAPEDRRQESIDAMARWLVSYRESLSPEEQADLKARLGTDEGQAMLKRATAQYNAQDVQYRGSTAGVISELLRTIHRVQETP